MNEPCSESHRLHAMADLLVARQAMMDAARSFLKSRDYLEVETPVRVPTPALEDYIDAEPSGDRYLRTSPELHMKRLLAAGYEKIFQLGPCFRKEEHGTLHHSEFCMLEWYRLHVDYRGILAETVELVRYVSRLTCGSTVIHLRKSGTVDLGAEWEQLTVDEAFARYAECTVDQALDAGAFEQVLVERVEPNLGQGRPAVLMDYPASGGGFVQTKPDCPGREERWELYIGGLEIANACSELTDYDQQKKRFEATARLRRAENREVYPLDPDFMQALEQGLSPCAGIAVGMDRLLMVLKDLDAISDAVPFPPER